MSQTPSKLIRIPKPLVDKLDSMFPVHPPIYKYSYATKIQLLIYELERARSSKL